MAKPAGTLIVVVGGQYGSEAKGAVAGVIASRYELLMAIRVAGPNAGHTVWGGDRTQPGTPMREFKLRHIPTAAVTHPSPILRIAAGSEINFDVLRQEINDLLSAGYHPFIGVDSQATLLEPQHVEEEEANRMGHLLGSTQEGVGAARSDRIMRGAHTVLGYFDVHAMATVYPVRDVADDAYNMLAGGGTVLVEGTQGFGLGLHAGYYPKCTSSDCRAIDMLAMAGISPWHESVGELQIWVVFRTLPIRVAGNSGPLYNEMSWESLGLPEERTTVTNKVRRVGGWDTQLAQRALAANGFPSSFVHVALTHVDQVSGEEWVTIKTIEEEIGTKVELVGRGPMSGDYEFRD